MTDPTSPPWWRNPQKLPFVVFLAIAGYFLWSEHRAHVIEFLPWLLIFASLGMHLFMHRGHGHRKGDDRNSIDSDRDGQENDEGTER